MKVDDLSVQPKKSEKEKKTSKEIKARARNNRTENWEGSNPNPALGESQRSAGLGFSTFSVPDTRGAPFLSCKLSSALVLFYPTSLGVCIGSFFILTDASVSLKLLSFQVWIQWIHSDHPSSIQKCTSLSVPCTDMIHTIHNTSSVLFPWKLAK